MPRLKLLLAYTGTRYCGWQIQDNAPTVQGSLEAALKKICIRKIRVHGAGRTDSGVHSLGQVAHCDIPESKSHVAWQKALNALLPKDIAVLSAQYTTNDFHARYSATGKIYSYTLWTEADYILPQCRDFSWSVGPLNLEAMLKARNYFLGQRDFASLQNTGTPVKSTVRTTFSLVPQAGCYPQQIVWRISGDGFLKQMVRNIMGCLVSVGKGKLNIAEIPAILEGLERSQAAATAPAQGLCLGKVLYAQKNFTPY